MDTEHDSQTFAPKLGKSPQRLPHPSSAYPDESDSQKLDFAWLIGVVCRRAPIMVGIAITLSVISGGIIVWNSKKIRPEYEGAFRLLVEPVTAEDRLAKQFLSSQSAGADIQRVDVEKSSLDYETQIRVLQSPTLLNPVLKRLQKKYPDMTYNSLLSNLALYRVTYLKEGQEEGTKIIEVSYRGLDPDKIQLVINELAKTYRDYSLLERQKSLLQGIKFIDQQLPELQTGVDALQKQIQQLRQQYNLGDPEQASYLLLEHSLGLGKDRLNAQTELEQSRTLYETLQKQLMNGNPTAVVSLEATDVYNTLVAELQRVEAQIAASSALFRDDSPPMQVLREKQENLRVLLRQQAEGIMRNLEGKIKGLEERYQRVAQAESQNNRRLLELPDATRRYTDLQRRSAVATDTLKQFLSKREALRLDAGQQQIPWDLIEAPHLRRDEDGNLISIATKQTRRQLIIAIVLSSLLGIGVGFLLEALNTVFHTPEDVKDGTKLPVLGVIPFTKELRKITKNPRRMAAVAQVAGLGQRPSDNLVLVNSPQKMAYITSPFLEAFRSLYTNIRLLSSASPINSVVISSAEPGDGKSTVAIYLAQTAAAIGQRVLLVDADLRRPQLHSRMGLSNVRGLSDAIATDLSINDSIQRSPYEENLFVLTAGQNPSDPIKLLSSDKMQYLMEQFQARFDLVIYDTPPLVGLADGSLLAAHTDGTLLVVGIDQTDRSMVTKALEGLKISGASIVGVVANGIRGYTTNSYASYSRV